MGFHAQNMIFNDSRNVADHINYYSEGDPESWFIFFVKEEAEY
jgi:hypothetical protein